MATVIIASLNFSISCILFGLVFITHPTTTNAGGLRLLGGYTEVRPVEARATSPAKYIHEWGYHEKDIPGKLYGRITFSYCWNTFTESMGYCNQFLVFSAQNEDEFYEIIGTRLVVMDSDRRYIDTTKHQYGKQFASTGEYDFIVYSGSSWSPGNRRWGYAYLHYIVERSTRQPVTDAFSMQARNAGSEYYSETEEFRGSRESTSTRNTIGEFRCWTRPWGDDSNCYAYIWRAETKMVGYSLRYDDKDILGTTDTPNLQPLVIENRGSGMSTIDLPRIENSEQIVSTSTARFSRSFDFAIDVSLEIGFNALGFAAGSTGIDTHFGFSSTQEMEATIENSVAKTITWPSRCDPGFRLTYNVVEHSERQRIPVDFEFERAEQRWNETNDVEVTLKWIEVNVNDCCLYTYADEANCGTERLPMCDV